MGFGRRSFFQKLGGLLALPAVKSIKSLEKEPAPVPVPDVPPVQPIVIRPDWSRFMMCASASVPFQVTEGHHLLITHLLEGYMPPQPLYPPLYPPKPE
jgi:hypothetical protein